MSGQFIISEIGDNSDSVKFRRWILYDILSYPYFIEENRYLFKPYTSLINMTPETIKVNVSDILQIKKDIQFIKDQFMEETELTDWAKKELDNARKTPRKEYISMEEIEKEFLQDDL